MIKSIVFLQSEVDWWKAPPPSLPEYAFIGRSNVGKSSLINMLANHKTIAKTSSKPGKTQTINHFLVNNAWYLVDLPGYGYAKISKTMREKWAKMIHDYLVLRENLQVVFVALSGHQSTQKLLADFSAKPNNRESFLPIFPSWFSIFWHSRSRVSPLNTMRYLLKND